MPNFSSLAGLEVGEKFVRGWGGEHVTTMSNSNASCFGVELRWVLTKIKLETGKSLTLPKSFQSLSKLNTFNPGLVKLFLHQGLSSIPENRTL